MPCQRVNDLPADACPSAKCVVWYSQGDVVEVVVDGRVISVQLVGRKGRRSRIAITAPAGSKFIEKS